MLEAEKKDAMQTIGQLSEMHRACEYRIRDNSGA